MSLSGMAGRVKSGGRMKLGGKVTGARQAAALYVGALQCLRYSIISRYTVVGLPHTQPDSSLFFLNFFQWRSKSIHGEMKKSTLRQDEGALVKWKCRRERHGWVRAAARALKIVGSTNCR